MSFLRRCRFQCSARLYLEVSASVESVYFQVCGASQQRHAGWHIVLQTLGAERQFKLSPKWPRTDGSDRADHFAI